MTVVAVLLAPLDARAFCFLVAGTQVSADAVGASLTLAQFTFFGWIVMLPWSGWLRHWGYVRRFAVHVGPLLVWVIPVLAINGTFHLLGGDLMLAVLFGAIVAAYVGSVSYGPKKVMPWLLGGMALAAIGYLGARLGAPVVRSVYEASPFRPVERIGSGRGDANVVGLNLPIAMWGFVALGLVAVGERKRIREVFAPVLAVALLLPASIATASRTAMYSLAGGAVGFVVFAARLHLAFRLSARRRLAVALVVGLASVALVAPIFSDEVGEYLSATLSLSKEQARESGSSAYVAGRTSVWFTHLDLLAHYPVFGVPAGTVWDFGEYGTSVIGVSGTFGAAHNTFLEFGSLAGLPGLLLFSYVIMMPMVRTVVARRHDPTYAAFGVIFFVLVLGISGLSVPSWKTLWAFVAIALQASTPENVRSFNPEASLGTQA